MKEFDITGEVVGALRDEASGRSCSYPFATVTRTSLRYPELGAEVERQRAGRDS